MTNNEPVALVLCPTCNDPNARLLRARAGKGRLYAYCASCGVMQPQKVSAQWWWSLNARRLDDVRDHCDALYEPVPEWFELQYHRRGALDLMIDRAQRAPTPSSEPSPIEPPADQSLGAFFKDIFK